MLRPFLRGSSPRKTTGSVLLAVALAAGSSTALLSEHAQAQEAQPTEDEAAQAREHFNAGNHAFAEGKYEEAALAFEEAHRLKPHAAVLFNAAQAWEHAEKKEYAADRYAEALKRTELGADRAVHARKSLKALRQTLGWVELAGEDGVRATVGTIIKAELPSTTHLLPGKHTIHAVDNDGKEWTQSVLIKADRPGRVFLKRPEEKAPVEKKKEPVSVPVPALKETPKSNVRRTYGYAALGVGGALGLTSVVLGVATLNTNSKYEDGGFVDSDLRSRAVSLRTWTNVLAVSGTVVGATGLVLLLTGPEEREVSLSVTPELLRLQTRF